MAIWDEIVGLFRLPGSMRQPAKDLLQSEVEEMEIDALRYRKLKKGLASGDFDKAIDALPDPGQESG